MESFCLRPYASKRGRVRHPWIIQPAMVWSTAMARYLEYRAGPGILDMIRQEGLDPRRVRVFTGPAGGPKWFVSVGFDRAIMKSRFLARSGRVLLAGSSAGAWRCIAMACPEPLTAYERLRLAYSRIAFAPDHTPSTVGQALWTTVEAFLREEDIPFVLEHPVFDLAIHTALCRGPAASDNRRIQGAALIAAAILNAVSISGMRVFFDRVVFFSGPGKPAFAKNEFRGTTVRLSAENIRKAAVATGSLPYFVEGVTNVSGALPGVYRDGGLTDYQLNEDYCAGDDGIILFYHYQERIIPGWFDKMLSWRKPPAGSLDRVLQVFPAKGFVDLLPDGRLPDRNDFAIFVNRPEERIRRWDEVARLSRVLGEEFLDDVDSGRIRNLVRPLR